MQLVAETAHGSPISPDQACRRWRREGISSRGGGCRRTRRGHLSKTNHYESRDGLLFVPSPRSDIRSISQKGKGLRILVTVAKSEGTARRALVIPATPIAAIMQATTERNIPGPANPRSNAITATTAKMTAATINSNPTPRAAITGQPPSTTLSAVAAVWARAIRARCRRRARQIDSGHQTAT